jgi:hypothetical protein
MDGLALMELADFSASATRFGLLFDAHRFSGIAVPLNLASRWRLMFVFLSTVPIC